MLDSTLRLYRSPASCIPCSMWTSVTTTMRSLNAVVRTRLWFEDCLLAAEAHTPSSSTTSSLLEIGTAPGQSMRGSPISACRSRVGAFLPLSPVPFFLCKTRKRNTIKIKSNFRLSFRHPRHTPCLSPSDYDVYSYFLRMLAVTALFPPCAPGRRHCVDLQITSRRQVARSKCAH